MSNSQNINMGRKRRQGNMPPQKANNHKTEDLVDREVEEVRRMMITMFNKKDSKWQLGNRGRENELQESGTLLRCRRHTWMR
jgi:hypothetical protein